MARYVVRPAGNLHKVVDTETGKRVPFTPAGSGKEVTAGNEDQAKAVSDHCNKHER